MAGSLASQLILFNVAKDIVYGGNRKYMETLKVKLNDIAEVLYSGDTTLGMARMGEVIGDLAQVGAMITDEDLRDRYINDGLSQALSAMESEDGTLLADVISYELIEIIDSL